jgi:hypothetical protein
VGGLRRALLGLQRRRSRGHAPPLENLPRSDPRGAGLFSRRRCLLEVTGGRGTTRPSRRAPSNNESSDLLCGSFNASSTIPVHGAGPWVIVETPTRHHPRRRGRPIPRRLLLGWSERVRIRQRLRAHICAGSGRTPGATPKKQRRHHARTRRGFFGNPRLFCAPTSTSKEEPGRCAAAKLFTRDEARPRRQYRQAAGAACASDQGPPHFRRASSIDSSRSGGRLKGLICPINAIWSRRRIRPFKRART